MINTKTNKLTKTIITVFFLYMMFSSTVFATTNDTLLVKVDRNLISWQDAQPFVDTNNRTLIPMRDLGNALGLEVAWDNETQQVTFIKEGSFSNFPDNYKEKAQEENTMKITFKLGNPEYQVYFNDEFIKSNKMDTSLVSKNNRVYAPLRYLASELGYNVRFSSFTHTINVESEIISSEPAESLYFEIDAVTEDDFEAAINGALALNVNKFSVRSPLATSTTLINTTNNAITKAQNNFLETYSCYGQMHARHKFYKDYVLSEFEYTPKTNGIYISRLVPLHAEDLRDWLYATGKLNSNMSEKEKAYNIRKYFITNGIYDRSGENYNTSWSALEKGRGNCNAFAGAYQAMLKLEDITCWAQAGSTEPSTVVDHIWTNAAIDGILYYIDATPTWVDEDNFTNNWEVFSKTHYPID